MKKYSWLLALLCVIALLFAAGCGGGGGGGTPGTPQPKLEVPVNETGLALEITVGSPWGEGVALEDFTFAVGDRIILIGSAKNDFPPAIGAAGMDYPPSQIFYVWANGRLDPSVAWELPQYVFEKTNPKTGDKLDFDKALIKADIDALEDPESELPAIIIGGRCETSLFVINQIVIARGTDVLWSLSEDFLTGKTAKTLAEADFADSTLQAYGASVVVKIIADE